MPSPWTAATAQSFSLPFTGLRATCGVLDDEACGDEKDAREVGVVMLAMLDDHSEDE